MYLKNQTTLACVVIKQIIATNARPISIAFLIPKRGRNEATINKHIPMGLLLSS